MYCTRCKEYRNSRYSSCKNSCDSGDCEHICATCGQHSLIDSEVVCVGKQLGLNQNNPILEDFQKLKAQVNAGGWRDEFTMEISQRTVEGYFGPKRYIVYDKNKKFQYTGVTFHTDY
ncbi:hypothetical protein Glove_320g53 [Diversispora epigaea]|uniref:Uncharacterized protein n=1 Tax=Diversispora epigaea TaxID=1348612 RepID=A0A397HNN7_9GLOM|nr:hypothetical protein Glove_320g53 [Diversispora epigaea]